MKYVYQEPVVTTVEDREITEDAEMKQLFQNLCDQQHNVEMVVADPEHPEFLKRFDNVRITAVKENTINLHAFFAGASAKFNDIPFLNVRKIKVVANKSLIGKKYRVSRWHMMDVAEIEET